MDNKVGWQCIFLFLNFFWHLVYLTHNAVRLIFLLGSVSKLVNNVAGK